MKSTHAHGGATAPVAPALAACMNSTMRDEALLLLPVRGDQGFHELPAGVVGGADVADLAGTDEVVERGGDALDWSQGVKLVNLEQIDESVPRPRRARSVARIR